MAVGRTLTRVDIDARVLNLAVQIREMFAVAQRMAARLPATDAPLTALGFSTQEIADLRAFVGDSDQLRQIYEGAVALPSAKDFRVSAVKVTGLD